MKFNFCIMIYDKYDIDQTLTTTNVHDDIYFIGQTEMPLRISPGVDYSK